MFERERQLEKKIRELDEQLERLWWERRVFEQDADRYKELFFYMCDGYQELKEKFENLSRSVD